MRASVLGGSGYVGGELLRLLLGHPEVELGQVASRRFAGKRVDSLHPNLRGQTDLRFSPLEALEECDVLLSALPHGSAMRVLPGLLGKAKLTVDLSADFRLRQPATYRRYYDAPHQAEELVASFVPGLPEIFPAELTSAERIAVPGCTANAAILALHPLARERLLEAPVLIDARTGSSGSGTSLNPASQHAERSGAMRVFAPQRHRHEAEVAQATGLEVHMSATGVEAVRGVQVLCRARSSEPLDERRLREIYRDYYGRARFVRIVAHRKGTFRLPEPKILLGSNYCDVGFASDPERGEVVLVAALDNLVKGGAGNAVQCLNLRMGYDEGAGLGFPGLHPI